MRGKGESSVFKDKRTGLWTAVIELPPHDGKRRRKFIRRKLKKDLLLVLDEEKTNLKLRGDLVTKGITVGAFLEYWVEQVAAKEVRPNTLDGYRRSIKNHITPVIGHLQLSKLSGPQIGRVHDHILGKGLSSTTALLAHRIMSAAFKTATREKRITFNPANDINAPRKAVAPQEALDVEEAVQLLRHLSGDDKWGARFATSLLTGARRGEVLGIELNRVTDDLDLSWQLQRLPITKRTGKPDVPADFEYRHLTGGLYLTRPKSSAGWRIFPLVDPLRSILLDHIDKSEPNPYGLLFTNNGEPIDPDKDSKVWRKVLTAAGIEKPVVLHGLRHTAVDLLFLAGVPEDLIMAIVGHSTRTTTRAYLTRGSANRLRLEAGLRQFSELLTDPSGAHSEKPAAIDQ